MIKMEKIKFLFSVIILSWIGGFFYYIYTTDNFALENKTRTDVIVVFGDSRQKLYTSVQLLKLGYAPLIYTTGKSPASQYQNFIASQNLTPEQFIFDTSFAGDHDYAKETATFMEEYQVDSIRLVISSYQMPRAMLEITSHAPRGTLIIPHPVSRKGESYNLLFREYNNLLFVYLKTYLGLKIELDIPYP